MTDKNTKQDKLEQQQKRQATKAARNQKKQEAKKALARKKFDSSLASWKEEKAALLAEDKEKSRKLSALQKSLGRLVFTHPEFRADAEAADVPADTLTAASVRVMDYGTIGRIVVRSDDGSVAGDDVVSPSEIMRARHEYYNMLVAASLPAVSQIRKLLEGPEWAKGVAHQKLIDETVARKNAQYSLLHGKTKLSKSEAELAKGRLAQLSGELTALFKERQRLQTLVWKENRANYKLHAAEIRALTKERGQAVTAARHKVAPQAFKKGQGRFHFALYDGDYSAVEESATRSFQDSLEAKWVNYSESKYRYGNSKNERPANLLQYRKWNGEGSISVILSQPDRRTTVKDVMSGESRRVRLRPMVKEDLSVYGLSPTFLDKRSTRLDRIQILENKGDGRPERIQELSALEDRNEEEAEELRALKAQETELLRLHAANQREDATEWYVVSLRHGGVNSGLWTTIPIKLHRPLSKYPDAVISGARIHSVKKGFRTKVKVQFTVKSPQAPRKTEGHTVEVKSCSLTMPDGRIKVATLSGAYETGDLFIPAEIGERLQKSVRLMGYISKHLNHALTKIKELADGGNLYHPTIEDFYPKGRGDLRYGLRQWVAHLKKEGEADAVQTSLTTIFSRIRFRHKENKEKKQKQGTYGGSYENTWAMVVEDLQELLGMTEVEASNLAVLALFSERFNHLYPWATSLREKAMAYRREIYRVLASRLASLYGSIRYLKGGGKQTAPTQNKSSSIK